MYYAISDGVDYLSIGFNTTSKFEVKEALLKFLEPNTNPSDFYNYCKTDVVALCNMKGWSLRTSATRFKTTTESQLEIEVSGWLTDNLYPSIGIDEPVNHNKIVDFIVDDVKETADPCQYNSNDFAISFRRFLEIL